MYTKTMLKFVVGAAFSVAIFAGCGGGGNVDGGAGGSDPANAGNGGGNGGAGGGGSAGGGGGGGGGAAGICVVEATGEEIDCGLCWDNANPIADPRGGTTNWYPTSDVGDARPIKSVSSNGLVCVGAPAGCFTSFDDFSSFGDFVVGGTDSDNDGVCDS